MSGPNARTHIPVFAGSSPAPVTCPPIENMPDDHSIPAPDLNDIAAAIRSADGKTPSPVIDAFLPAPVSHLGRSLVALTAGHELLLSQTRHPLTTGAAWEDQDVLMALFIFSNPSRLLFARVADGTFEAEFFLFIDSIPASDISSLGAAMIGHWLSNRKTALPMHSEHSSGQKKTADSDGCSAPSARPARFMAGFLKWCSMTFRCAKSSL